MRRIPALRSAWTAAILLALTLALTACGGPRVPSGAPTMSGVMRAISESTEGTTILVYADGDITRLAARVDTDTILLRDAGGHIEPATLSEFVPGRKAEVWVDGPLMETYPLQGHAGTLLLLDH